ncbi:MAG TPA: carbohydrate kinase family protein [Balneolales bacterium]|nr:carbohydrate kinase family protein [Balneolales bacterium]
MNKLFDVIVVGELNIDMILNRIEGLPEIGKEKISGDMEMTLGSSSAIFASNISSLGAKVTFFGKIGADSLGDFVIQSLKTNQVDTSLIIKDAKLKTGVTVALNYNEDRAMVTYPGAMEALTLDDISDDDLKKARHLHVSSVFLQTGLKKDVGELFKKAKNLGLTTSLDTQWDPDEKWDLNLSEILPYVDVFLPNEAELLNLTHQPDISKGLNELQEYASLTVVKMGSQGSLSHSKENKILVEAFSNQNVIDAIGAGDSFNAGFIYKYLQSESVRECQKFGNLIGAISTTAPGGTTAFQKSNNWKKTAIEKFDFKIND